MQDRQEGQKEGGDDDTIIQLLPGEINSAILFLALGTQWRENAMTGIRTGMIYSEIEPTARLSDIAVTPQMFADLKLMEAAALGQFVKNRKRERG